MENNIYATESPVVDKYTMQNMRQRFGLEENDTSADKEIFTMSGYEFLNELLHWEGFIGYTDMILDAIYMAYGVSLEELNEMEMRRELDKE